MRYRYIYSVFINRRMKIDILNSMYIYLYGIHGDIVIECFVYRDSEWRIFVNKDVDMD